MSFKFEDFYNISYILFGFVHYTALFLMIKNAVEASSPNSAKVHSSNESLIVAEKSDKELDNKKEKTEKSVIPKKIYPPFWALCLPVFLGVGWRITFDIPDVLSSYYNISERPIITNPCNASDSEAFQTFVALWKEKKENQTALFYKVIADADVPEIKEKFEEEIHAAADKILAELIVPEYRTFEKCHSQNNKSKRMFIAIYFAASYVLLIIGYLSIFFFIRNYDRFFATGCDTNINHKYCGIKETLSLCYIVFPFIYVILFMSFYNQLSSKVADEFVI